MNNQEILFYSILLMLVEFEVCVIGQEKRNNMYIELFKSMNMMNI